MSIKIIATDLDGTLMSADHITVTERTKAALKKSHDNSVKIAIATGRPLKLVGSVLEQVPFVDYVIYSNGACVFDRNKNEVIYSDLIDVERTEKIVDYFLNERVFFEVYIDGKSHFQQGFEKYFSQGDIPDEFVSEVTDTMTPHENLAKYTKGKMIEKVTAYSVQSERYDDYKSFLTSLDLTAVTSFKDSIEATVSTASKGRALEGICTSLGLTSSEAMSFGDAGNDCPMLAFAKYSFAMANATQECKNTANFITDSNADDGLAKAVEKYVLADV
ncbi:MAG: Cof-type HAD-IIB family hydrolase [Clostridiales bacterium]|nr:Cof-type HAD-IIB family hydrolase [Clostridiales bacterium]